MQKKVLALHDLSGFGRSSLVPIISVLSAFGHQCVPLPTAVFSTHMAIPGWVKSDLTGEMHPTIDQYDRLGLRFEAVYAGFLGSASQIDSVREAAERLKAENGLTLIDPVMGDNGEVYSSYTPEMCTRMRALYEEYGASVVLTGLDYEPGRVGSGCLENGELTISLHERIDCYYPGTGDVFAAVMLGALLGGSKLRDACVEAGEFVRDTIAYTAQQGTDPNFGVQFEKLLPRLWNE